MFELPEAKRVRREDLGDSDQSDVDEDNAAGNDAAMQSRVNAQIAAALGLDDDDEPPVSAEPIEHNTDNSTQRTNAAQVDGDADPDKEQGYEFNLFSTAGPGGSTKTAKVILEDPAAPLGDGAFVRPRPLSFFTTKTVSAKEKEQYSYAAVTGAEIVRWSTQPSWGMAMPWKVISIKATRTKKVGDDSTEVLMENADQVDKRKRPGKKQRVLQRQRKRSRAQVMEEATKKQVEKEEHLKDKKKRLNRIKKLRKRAKDKEKKLAAGGETAGADTTSESEGDD
ncbi:hypothetical protein ISF_03940 [Cordyceps fumosorosea ARSEF 2679]|uniref:Uncharacterized protein n=1 Tax=Cordyceps fumosorosea (strain ARSEF 2679) TaxID=1081104 RepID=A0A162JAI6_CORFA|nr:hypothetical protein ISF_03940 [Cordyceps fumosorosea ARSEF 2679]OAA66102.1 hypothetical protein ISF_03940 [Cordyceps fumosorosea ARSEF 2679]